MAAAASIMGSDDGMDPAPDTAEGADVGGGSGSGVEGGAHELPVDPAAAAPDHDEPPRTPSPPAAGTETPPDASPSPPASPGPSTPPFSSPELFQAPSADGASVRSDHPDDYYDGPRAAGNVSDDSSDGGAASACASYYGEDHDDDEDSAASSIHSLHSCEFIAAYNESSRETTSRKDSQQSSGVDERSYCSEDSYDEDDDSLGFPPGHITRADELKELQNHGERPTDKKSVNPSVIPSYFFCPIGKTIMKDPVITPDGHTFERRAILRSLILEPVDPISKKPLSHEELRDDYLVRTAIDKARKEAWIRYVVEFKEEEVEKIVEQEKEWEEKSAGEILDARTDDSESDHEGEGERGEPLMASPREEALPQSPPEQRLDQQDISHSLTDDSNRSGPTIDDGMHGWSVPLGVHKIVCEYPGLVVTSDVHRRSNVAKRKIIKQTLVEDHDATGKKGGSKKMKMRKRKSKKKKHKGLKTVTDVISRDLMLPPGSHVEILETRVHGGRVRGRIVWEEEVATEVDRELQLLLEEEEVRKRAMQRPATRKSTTGGEGEGKVPPSPRALKKQLSKKLFRRKNSLPELPFTSELFDRPPHSPPAGKRSRSPSPLTTIKYGGWISLQWAGSVNNHERDETIKLGRNDATAALYADQDEGPWTEPLPLGVYRISGDLKDAKGSSAKQLPLYDAADSDSNIIDFLVCNQCLEIVETRVLVMRKWDGEQSRMKLSTSEGQRVVRARCMVPVILSPVSVENVVRDEPVVPQKKFRSGWITLSSGENSVTAAPIPTGAYIVTSDDPLMSCDSSAKIKAIFPTGSCMEVDATRIEFEEEEKVMKCHSCSKENKYHCVAVRALVSSGGYVTLFTVSVGVSGTHGSLCACGKLVQQTYAEPVPLGTYRMTGPMLLTQGSGLKSPVMTQLKQNACVTVLDTRVEDGCVRGRVNAVIANDVNGESTRRQESVTGWVSMFEPPSSRWAELTSKAAV